eukprot:gene17500-23811_t
MLTSRDNRTVLFSGPSDFKRASQPTFAFVPPFTWLRLGLDLQPYFLQELPFLRERLVISIVWAYAGSDGYGTSSLVDRVELFAQAAP